MRWLSVAVGCGGWVWWLVVVVGWLVVVVGCGGWVVGWLGVVIGGSLKELNNLLLNCGYLNKLFYLILYNLI